MAGPLLYHGRKLAADPGREPDGYFTPGHRGVPVKGWLADPAQRDPGGPVEYAGQAVIASWCGVNPSTLSRRLGRNDGWPAEDARLEPGRQGEGSYDRYWEVTEANRERWVSWAGSLPGRGGARTGNLPGNRAKAGVSVPALIGAAVIDGVTAGFAFRATVTSPNLKVLAAMDAAGGRLLVTGKGTGRVVWARDKADADTASAAIPALAFRPAR